MRLCGHFTRKLGISEPAVDETIHEPAEVQAELQIAPDDGLVGGHPVRPGAQRTASNQMLDKSNHRSMVGIAIAWRTRAPRRWGIVGAWTSNGTIATSSITWRSTACHAVCALSGSVADSAFS